jgi:hypothetical protein
LGREIDPVRFIHADSPAEHPNDRAPVCQTEYMFSDIQRPGKRLQARFECSLGDAMMGSIERRAENV